MRIIFVRHGDPDYVKDSLTQKGFREVELLANRLEKLDIKDIYCSPYGRAQDTAKPLLQMLNRTAVTYEWMREFAGTIIDPKTGKTHIPWDFLPSYWTADERFYDKDKWRDTDVMHTGDVLPEYDRVCAELDKLIASYGYKRNGNYYTAEKPNTDTIVIFCHFGVQCVFLSHILGFSPVALWQMFISVPSSVTTLISEEREEGIASFRCNGFGDISHLYAGDEPPAFAGRFCEAYTNTDERH